MACRLHSFFLFAFLLIGYSSEALSAMMCSSHKEEASCTADNCLWDETSCISKDTSSCSSAKKESSCKAMRWGCTWDDNSCMSTYTSSCSSAKKESSCNDISGCIWDKKCLSTSFFKRSACTNATRQDSCSRLGCLWGEDAKTCFDSHQCGYASDENTCAKSKSCTWIPESNVCVALVDDSCEMLDQTLCTSQKKICNWDARVTRCLSKKMDLTPFDTIKSDMKATLIEWANNNDLVLERALNTDKECAKQIDEPTCKKEKSCSWERTLRFCLPAQSKRCFAMTSGPACAKLEKDGCFWNKRVNLCQISDHTSCPYLNQKDMCSKNKNCEWNGKFCQQDTKPAQ